MCLQCVFTKLRKYLLFSRPPNLLSTFPFKRSFSGSSSRTSTFVLRRFFQVGRREMVGNSSTLAEHFLDHRTSRRVGRLHSQAQLMRSTVGMLKSGL
uniref:Uncharacterized protein n=1 Tax=Ditylenchus dipsaci TaxID=166011 RepID=A0A915CNT1_9BILA